MTTIPLDNDFGPGVPVLKRRRIGETFTGMLAYIERRPRRNIAGDPVIKADGKPAQEEVLTLVTLPGASMTAGIGDGGDAVPAPGDVVRMICRAGSYAALIEAKRALGRGAVVGDVVTLTHTHADVYNVAGGKPIATYSSQDQVDLHRSNSRPGTLGFRGPITLRASTDDEARTWLDAAIAAHHAAAARKAGAAERPAAPSAYGADYGDDAPF